jgi:23S rRNA pseudouridine1911/1915/1917 synthase
MRECTEEPVDNIDGGDGGEESSFILDPDRSGERADVFLSRRLGITRSFARKLILEDHLERLSGPRLTPAKLKPSHKMVPGESYTVRMPPPESLEIEPEDVPFDVVYEDEFLLVVNKPAGIVAHPAPGHWTGTLVHGLMKRYPGMGPFNNVRRPGIVHRLDATTSGLMIVARDQRTMDLLQKGFKERTIDKRYLALTRGTFAAALEGVLEGPIGRHPANRLKMAVVNGGRPSTTEYRVLWSRNGLSLVLCKLITGRTHQIRVHMAAAGHPLVGDALYGAGETPGFRCGRVFLHSWRLELTHPITGRPLRLTCPLPEELKAFLKL